MTNRKPILKWVKEHQAWLGGAEIERRLKRKVDGCWSEWVCISLPNFSQVSDIEYRIVEPELHLRGWVNVYAYASGLPLIYPEKTMATGASGIVKRIACIEIDIPYKKGDGL